MITTKVMIKVPAAKVWQALTDKNQMMEWYFDIPDFELKTGTTFNFYEPGGANKFHHRCTIKEILPFKKFAHTWTHPSHSKGESMITWLLHEENGITRVTLEHDGIENFADAGPEFAPENYQMGWEGFMAILKNYMYGIRKHTYQIEVNASPEKVWNVLFNDQTFRQWTSVFSEGSHYQGELKQGERIHFLAPEGMGMYADIIFCTPHTNILFQHIGQIEGFVEQPIDDEVEKWSGSFENYILIDNDGSTTLKVELDITQGFVKFFNEKFPLGLTRVKELSELV